jgi:hypothetical protein
LTVAYRQAALRENRCTDLGNVSLGSANLRVKIDRKIAHETLDDTRPQAIFAGQLQASRRGELASLDGARIRADIRRVLNIALRQSPDRRGAKADQGVRRIRRIALKITVQPPSSGSMRQIITSRCEMIEAYRYVAAFLQRLGRRMHLRHAFTCIRKRSLINQPLVRLEPRDVSISEQGEPPGLERCGKLGAVDYVADSLPGQTIHQVDVDAGDTGGTQGCNRLFDLPERLEAADRVLHVR